MILTAAIVAVATLVVGIAIAAGLRLLPTLRLQIAGLAALAVCLPLAAVLLSGWVMFHMGDDVKILAVSAAAAAVAVVAGLWLSGTISDSIDRVREASARLASGDLSVRAPESGAAEIAEMAVSFNRMAESLEQLFDARRELVAWASHDLRTPLHAMQSMVEALEDGIGDPERYLPSLREQVRTLGALVDDLFELAQIDAGALTLELHDATADALVAACMRTLEPEAEARRVHLEARVDAGTALRCAPEKVERVLLNLVTNSLRHTPSDGSVAVVVQPEENEVRFTVEDTGDGISPEAGRRMFDRFWRGDPARTGGRSGAGLGLAIARGLVEAHGGRIWAESRPGGGARVSFTLPAHP